MRKLAIVALFPAIALAACGGGSPSHSPTPGHHTHDTEVAPTGDATPAPDAGAGAAADLGFTPKDNGFSFPNYGNDYPGMTADDVRSMFGDAVCASTDNDTCLLTPPAQQWMDQVNKDVSDGHCYGFSVTALELFRGTLRASDYGADAVPQLQIQNNSALQRRLATGWASQLLDSVQSHIIRGTPDDILDKLIAYLQAGQSGQESYTLTIYKRDGSGGHAVTPYAAVDKGNGQVGVLIYDNNWPGVVRELLFDRTANTWSYNASINPNEPSELYEGDATTQSISLYPTTPGEGVQPCPFCGNAPAPVSVSPGHAVLADDASPGKYEISLDDADPDSHAHIVFSDGAGHHTGIVNGKLANEIPGYTAVVPVLDHVWKESPEPVFSVPEGQPVTFTLDASGMAQEDTESLSIVGTGMDVAIDGIDLRPGDVDTVSLSADGTSFTYKTTRDESPTVEIGRDGDPADHSAQLQVSGEDGGTTLVATLTDGTLTIGGGGSTSGTYDLTFYREDDNGEQQFNHGGISLGSGDSIVLKTGAFQKKGDSIAATRSAGGRQSQETLNDEG